MHGCIPRTTVGRRDALVRMSRTLCVMHVCRIARLLVRVADNGRLPAHAVGTPNSKNPRAHKDPGAIAIPCRDGQILSGLDDFL